MPYRGVVLVPVRSGNEAHDVLDGEVCLLEQDGVLEASDEGLVLGKHVAEGDAPAGVEVSRHVAEQLYCPRVALHADAGLDEPLSALRRELLGPPGVQTGAVGGETNDKALEVGPLALERAVRGVDVEAEAVFAVGLPVVLEEVRE